MMTLLHFQSKAQKSENQIYDNATYPKTVDEIINKNQPQYGVKKDFKTLFVVDSVHFYSKEEFTDLNLTDFWIEGKYFDNESDIVNLIIFIRTKE